MSRTTGADVVDTRNTGISINHPNHEMGGYSGRGPMRCGITTLYIEDSPKLGQLVELKLLTRKLYEHVIDVLSMGVMCVHGIPCCRR